MPRIPLAALTLALALIAPLVAAQEPQAYELRAGDTIEVSVLEDPSLGRTVLVRPDGRVSVPLAGAVLAAGRTPEQLAAALARALARDFVEPPTVTVSLVGLSPDEEDEEGIGTIYIVGQVSRPGPFEVELPINVLQALALSGGPGPFAARSRIQVRRAADNGATAALFDYEAVEDGLVPMDAWMLRDGDTIVVPERGFFE